MAAFFTVAAHRYIVEHQVVAEHVFRVDFAHLLINVRIHQRGDAVHHHLYDDKKKTQGSHLYFEVYL